jgi:cytochrome c oxidase subunit II
MSPWLPENVSTFGDKIDSLFYIILWITGIALVLVQATLVWFVIRYRRKGPGKAHYTHGNDRLELIWTAIPTAILVVLAFLSQGIWDEVRGGKIPKGALEIEVLAEQFAWNIRYPGYDVETINQVFIPVNRPVHFKLRSKDVIHSFFLPNFRVKQDVLPGMDVNVWFEANKTGDFEIACAELCGLGHYRMRGFLKVGSVKEFDQWIVAQKATDEEALDDEGGI